MSTYGAAFENFFAHRAKYPKFKSKRSAKQSFELYRKNDSSIRIRDGKWLFLKEEIALTEELRFSGTIKRLTCSKINDKYYISLIFDEEYNKFSEGETIGLDWGTYNSRRQGHFFTASNSKVYDLPDLACFEEKIKFRQRCLARTQKGSKRHEEAKAKLSRCYEVLNNFKQNAQNKLVHELVNTYSFIALENLSVKGMVKKAKGKRAKRRALLKYSNYRIFTAIKNKVFEFSEVSKYTPTSQVCSCCGALHPEMKDETLRVFICECGLRIDRDLNAAKNILHYCSLQK